MTFDEWLNETKGFGFRCRYERIQQFVGPERYPGVQAFLESAYLTGYQAGKDDTEANFPIQDLRE